MEIDRDVLKKRIEKRAEKMLASGWIEEVEALRARGYTEDDPGMRSHGYSEILDWLEIHDPLVETRESRVSPLTKKISTKVRRYAKRQRTWWRNDPRIHWIKK